MDKRLIIRLRKTFEDYTRQVEGVEFWFARDLQALPGYHKWGNFLNVVEKGMIACSNAGHSVGDHFPGVRKMVNIGSGAKREIDDSMVSCYPLACDPTIKWTT
ncbi:MAG: hypothetical protein V1735_01910 [Nanoarchaeota archaeon]